MSDVKLVAYCRVHTNMKYKIHDVAVDFEITVIWMKIFNSLDIISKKTSTQNNYITINDQRNFAVNLDPQNLNICDWLNVHVLHQ